jgi:hypothetical protein
MSNHGEIKPTTRQHPKAPCLPRMLQRALTIYSDYDRNVTANGLWEVRALEPLEVRGVKIAVGDKVMLPGNEAKQHVLDHAAEVTDDRAIREAQVLQEAEKLGLDKPAQPAPANFAQPRRKAWATGAAA